MRLYQSTHPLLIFILGAEGIGKTYNGVAEHLDRKVTVCTYHRRQSGASKVQELKILNSNQQSCDIIAIVKALGRQKTSIFANSRSSIVALQLAVSNPEYPEYPVAREAPITPPLDDSAQLLDRTFRIYETCKKDGGTATRQAFMSDFKMLEDISPLTRPPINLQNACTFGITIS